MFVWDRMSQSQAFSSHHQELLLILYLSNLTKISTNTETAMLSQDSSGRFKGSLFNVHCEKAFSKILRFLSQFTKKILVFFPHTSMQWRLESSFRNNFQQHKRTKSDFGGCLSVTPGTQGFKESGPSLKKCLVVNCQHTFAPKLQPNLRNA